ncbi:MAG: hypothetical protein KDA60_14105 [Planctomycetales bacterium]|nr:hypothetical protein [Planctomycetales bacterium]
MAVKDLRIIIAVCTLGLTLSAHGFAQQPSPAAAPATPVELVATYENLATVILGAKNAEEQLVRSILSTSYGHAHASLESARKAMQADDEEKARAALESLAAHVAQIGTEGDNAVAGIRKRLIEGGHHHNAEGESKGIYDPGFVVVTREAKQKLLEASRELAQLSRDPQEEAVLRVWQKVQTVWTSLAKKQ